MHPTTLLAIFTGLVAASEPGLSNTVKHYTGVATFMTLENSQIKWRSKIRCVQYLLTLLYSLSVPDSSRLNSFSCLGERHLWCCRGRHFARGGACYGIIDRTLCDGKSSVHSYVPPQCPKGNCGMSQKVTNMGGHKGASIGGMGNSIIVQIIDNCPSVNAWNFCKSEIPENERCSSRAPGTQIG